MTASRILVYRLGSLGDTVVSLPALHLIERTFPSAKRVLLTNFPVNARAPAAAAVLGESGLIHGYMRYSSGTRNPLELAALWWKLLRFRADMLIYLMPQRNAKAVRRDALFFRAAGIRRMVGLSAAQNAFPIWDEQAGLFEKESSRLCRLIGEIGDARSELLENWDLRLTTAETQVASIVLAALGGRPFIVCGPGTKMPSKDWGLENWKSLIRKLYSQLANRALILIGSKEDSAGAEQIKASWPGTSLNLCGKLSPRETAAVIKRADAFLGPDSGPMHLAAAVGVPAIIAFSARGRPGIWFPAGEGHQILYRKTDCFGCNFEVCIDRKNECLTSITVDDMYAATLRAIKVTI